MPMSGCSRKIYADLEAGVRIFGVDGAVVQAN
jgi:hypothetical protein